MSAISALNSPPPPSHQHTAADLKTWLAVVEVEVVVVLAGVEEPARRHKRIRQNPAELYIAEAGIFY